MRGAVAVAIAPSPRRAPFPGTLGGDGGDALRTRLARVPSGDARPPDDVPETVGCTATSRGPAGDPDRVARRALDIGRRTALGVLAGDVATADDVAQEVAIQALRHAHRLRDPAALDGWLHRTAVRAALHAVRRGRRRRAIEEAHVVEHRRTTTADGAEPADDLSPLLAALPERQRAALTLRYAHDLTDEEIAAALGCRAGTVRALLSRGRATVRERLAATGAVRESGPTSGGDDA